TRSAEDDVRATANAVPLSESIQLLRRRVSKSDEVPARADEVVLLNDLIQAYVAGLGEKAEAVLSSYPERAVDAFRRTLRDTQRALDAAPEVGETVVERTLPRERVARAETSKNLAGKFRRGVGYEGWK